MEKLTGVSLYTAPDGSGTVAGLNQGPRGAIHSQGGKSKCQVTQTAAGPNPNIFLTKEKKRTIFYRSMFF